MINSGVAGQGSATHSGRGTGKNQEDGNAGANFLQSSYKNAGRSVYRV